MNERDENRPPLLFIAIKKGFHHCVETLVEAGADVNEPKSVTFGVTPLIYAMQQKQDKCVNVIIQMGADVNKGDCSDKGSSLSLRLFPKILRSTLRF